MDFELPAGWHVLQCDTCLASLAWVEAEVAKDYESISDWHEALRWAVSEVEHIETLHNLRSKRWISGGAGL